MYAKLEKSHSFLVDRVHQSEKARFSEERVAPIEALIFGLVATFHLPLSCPCPFDVTYMNCDWKKLNEEAAVIASFTFV
jgi:hypothetical protein